MNDYYLVYHNLKGWLTYPLKEYKVIGRLCTKYPTKEVCIAKDDSEDESDRVYIDDEAFAYLFKSREQQTKFLEEVGVL